MRPLKKENRKAISKIAFCGDMLIPRRVYIPACDCRISQPSTASELQKTFTKKGFIFFRKPFWSFVSIPIFMCWCWMCWWFLLANCLACEHRIMVKTTSPKLTPIKNDQKSIDFIGVVEVLFTSYKEITWAKPKKKTLTFHHTGCLKRGSLFHGLWNNPHITG